MDRMPRGENRSSALLSREENEQVFSLIGPKCQSLATAVVQLFTTEDPSHSKWKKKDTGVLCLIKDNAKRSYFFRIYCLYRRAMIWEQEVYLQIEYKNPRPFLHTFEAEEYMAAFNFANENEADILRNILLEKIELRKIRREERRQRQSIGATVPRSSGSGNAVARHNGAVREMEPPPLPPQQPPPQAQPQPQPPPTASPQMFPPKTNNALGSYTLKSNKKLKRGKLTKADIGMPLDFKHVSHVGWDATKGFDLDKVPNADELRSFFTKAGVSETQLQDQETREFIYDFIESHGGLDAVKEDLHNVKLGLPPPPAAAAPPVPSRGAAPPHPPHPPAPLVTQTVSTEGKVDEPRETSRVGVRIEPSFYPEKPGLWISQMETQFNMKTDETKSFYTIEHLDLQYGSEDEDVIANPPSNDIYEKFETELVNQHSASQERKVKQLLIHEELGDCKLSQYYRLLNLAGPGDPQDFLPAIWTSSLPSGAQTITASQTRTSLEELTELADHIYDVVGPQVASTSAIAPGTSSTPTEDSAKVEITALKKQVELLTEKVELLSRPRSRSSYRSLHRSSSI